MAKKMAKKWTEKDEEFLRANFEKMNNEGLGKKIGVSARSVESKLGRLGLKRGKTAKVSKPAKTAQTPARKRKTQPVTRDIVHENVRCRTCLIVDGYTEKEETCRHCGAKLFKGDVL